MAETTREQLLKDLDELKEIIESPSLYLESYFADMRNDVDKEFTSKLAHQQDDNQTENELNQLWQVMIEKINSFEQQCISTQEMKQLFQNKTIHFIEFKDILAEWKRYLIDRKICIINDEKIRKKAFNTR